MKKMMFALAAMAVALTTLAYDAWKDPETGITWTYTVSGGGASVGGGSSGYPAVPRSTTGTITIPSTLGGCPVTSIGDWAFQSCSGLTSVTIPSSVTSIGKRAFDSCSGLTSVTIPSSVTSIGEYAFYGCRGLTSVTIPSSVTSIGYRAFYGCSGLGEGVVVCDGWVLCVNGDCPTTVTIPTGTKGIAGGAFSGCSGLTSVTIPSSVTNIGEGAFSYCGARLEFVVDEDNPTFKSVNGLLLTKDGKTLVSGVNGAVTIPEGVTSIGERAFQSCSGLTSVTIPSSVTNIGSAAFHGCSGLTSVTIPSSVTSIGRDAFSGCSGLTSVTIPSSATSIGDFAFFGCSGLTSVTIPSSVTNIGWYAFYECSGLTSVTIPSSVTSIGSAAFGGCSGLTSADFEGAPPSGVTGTCIATDAAIRYNVAYEDEWQTVIAKCGWTNATAYVPKPDPAPLEDGIEVVFVVPNGVGSMSVATYATNSVYGRLPEARRNGFTFAGWYASLDGTERVTAFSAVVPNVKTLYARWVEDEASLYAQWEANRYSVSFNANGGDGVMAAQQFLYDQAQTLNDNAFTKIGYTFKGWSAVPDGEVVYANGASVSNLTAEAGFAVALFAKWEKAIDVEADEIEEWVGYTLAPQFKKEGETNSQYRKRFERTFGDDYSAAFFMETGKIGSDGTRLCVWHDYVAGTDPLDSESQFKASVTLVDGKVTVSYTPELSEAETAKRLYKTFGKKKLTDENWVEVPAGSEDVYNFFKVTVEMR